MAYSFEVDPRPFPLGGGWKLRLLDDGQEVGSEVFPSGDEGYAEARAKGEEWLSSRGPDEA